jgi:hypothetical protein
MKRGCGLPPIGLPFSPIQRTICRLFRGPPLNAGRPVDPSGSTKVVRKGAARRRRVELAVREQLVELVPAPDLPGVDRLQRAGGPDEQRLIVVAPEHVERVRRRDGDLRLLLGGSENRLDREAELLRGLLRDVRRRELHPESEHA